MKKKPEFPCGPSFLKVLMLDYTRRLKFPPVFVQNYGEFLRGRAKLRSSWGETWNVKIGEEIFSDGEKHLCFEGGAWRKFATDLELDFGEIVFFEFNVCESTFDVTVFGTDCCERRISATAVESEGDSGFMGGSMSFESVMRSCNRHVMDIPMAVAIETGIAGKSSVKLQNAKGKEWVAELPIMKCGRIRMSKGWSTFFVENRLKVGDKCLFEFDPSSGNLVVKKEWEFSETEYKSVFAKRGRGRPPTVRGRGRPPTVRGRGRPPTVRGRGRGRPPKNILDVEFESDGDEDDSEILGGRKRRGRGRPRKNFSDMEPDSNSDGDEGDDDSEF